MKSIIVHVGYGNAGASAIDAALRATRDEAAARGVVPLLTALGFDGGRETEGASPGLRGEVARDADAVAKLLLEPLSRGTVHTVIWCQEQLWHEWDLLGTVASKVAEEARLKVVIYLRNHADWLVSTYLQWAVWNKRNTGRIVRFEDFMTEHRQQLNYPEVLSKWVAAVGRDNLIVRSYDAVGDVVADFFSVCGLDGPPASASDDQASTPPNYSLLSLFKVHNDQFNEAVSADVLSPLLRDADILDRSFHPVDPWPIPFDQQTMAVLAKRFSMQAKVIEAKHGVVLASAPAPLPMKPQYTAESAHTDLIAILGSLLMNFDTRLDKISKRMKLGRRRRRAAAQPHPPATERGSPAGGGSSAEAALGNIILTLASAERESASAAARREQRRAERSEQRRTQRRKLPTGPV